MNIYNNQLFHIYNRGNNSRRVFFSDANYRFFIGKMKKYLQPNCEILSWCLMPNHFHFIIFIKPDQDHKMVSKGVQILLSSYTRAVNKQENFTGSIFQQRTCSKAMIGDFWASKFYPKSCFNYIHQNPIKARMVKKMEDWRYSSFGEYLGKEDFGILNKSLAHELIDFPKKVKDFYRFSGESVPDDFEDTLDW
jgi:putative transposase